MIQLYQFHPLWNLPNVSPFCMKLETYLRMTKIPHEVICANDPRKAPKGKFPYIVDNGKKIADSGLIIDYLKQTYGDSLDVHLTPIQKALAIAIERMLEEHAYWTIVYTRWVVPAGWEITEKDFFGRMPFLLRLFVPNMVRKMMIKDLRAQGVGRHTPDEIYQLGKADVKALAELLGDQKFFFGEQPTSIDACVYAFAANSVQTPIRSPIQDYARSQPNLIAYCTRMHDMFYR